MSGWKDYGFNDELIFRSPRRGYLAILYACLERDFYYEWGTSAYSTAAEINIKERVSEIFTLDLLPIMSPSHIISYCPYPPSLALVEYDTDHVYDYFLPKKLYSTWDEISLSNGSDIEKYTIEKIKSKIGENDLLKPYYNKYVDKEKWTIDFDWVLFAQQRRKIIDAVKWLFIPIKITYKSVNFSRAFSDDELQGLYGVLAAEKNISQDAGLPWGTSMETYLFQILQDKLAQAEEKEAYPRFDDYNPCYFAMAGTLTSFRITYGVYAKRNRRVSTWYRQNPRVEETIHHYTVENEMRFYACLITGIQPLYPGNKTLETKFFVKPDATNSDFTPRRAIDRELYKKTTWYNIGAPIKFDEEITSDDWNHQAEADYSEYENPGSYNETGEEASIQTYITKVLITGGMSYHFTDTKHQRALADYSPLMTFKADEEDSGDSDSDDSDSGDGDSSES